MTSLWGKVTGPDVISPEEIEGALHLPVLAIIPHIERRKSDSPTQASRLRRIDLEGRWRSRLISNLPDKNPAVLAYQALGKDLHERSRAQRQ